VCAAGRARARGPGEVEQVLPLGVVEVQGPGDRVQHGLRRPGDLTSFDAGVVLDADVGQQSDFSPAQTGHPTVAADR
jgi:hypothetical protein